MSDWNFDKDIVVDRDKLHERQNLEPPKKWMVVFLNDDYTPFDYVAEELIASYGKSLEEAFQITKSIHEQGKGIAGIYVKDIAETKAALTNATAQMNEYPLKAIINEVN